MSPVPNQARTNRSLQSVVQPCGVNDSRAESWYPEISLSLEGTETPLVFLREVDGSA
jgi:hypothetical protein